MRWLAVVLLAVLLTGCDYVEKVREIGYKGRARVDPWLAAERFCKSYGQDVRSLASWERPEFDDAVWFVPAAVLGNRSYVRQMAEWVGEGGHLVLLLENAGGNNDWNDAPPEPELADDLVEWLESAGLELREPGKPIHAKRISLHGRKYEVDASSKRGVAREGRKTGVFASAKYGDGRVSVVTDARIFRNRWIGEHEHAALLDALVNATEYEGSIGFLRGSGLSLWTLLGRHLWPPLAALGALILLWLWKNLARFGPLEAERAGPPLAGYEHHLEALGDFQWRLDRGSALLAPLRDSIVENAQRLSVRAGQRDQDIFQFLADRAALPRDRVFRALTDLRPADPATLTRTAADLQTLLGVLH